MTRSQIEQIFPKKHECLVCDGEVELLKSSFEQYQPSVYVCKNCKCEMSKIRIDDKNAMREECIDALLKADLCKVPNETLIDIKLQLLAQQDCGSNSCLFAGRGKGGMRTNGGCMCHRPAAKAIRDLMMKEG